MRYKTSPVIWLTLLTILALRSADPVRGSTKYNQQIIAILENDPTIEKAAHFLYGKHDTTSHVVKWNGNEYEQVRWNEQTQSHEPIPDPEPLPISAEDWPKTRIQVVGHGDINVRPTTVGGFTPDLLAENIVNGLQVGDVGRISVVGCQNPSYDWNTGDPKPPGFLSSFMKKLQKLKKFKTEASVRSELVSVDSTGRKLTGELLTWGHQNQQTNLEWSHKKPATKWIGRFKKKSFKIEAYEPTGTEIESHYIGILPEFSDLYVSKYDSNSKELTNTYKVRDDQAFEWVDRIAENTYTNAREGRAREVSRQIKTLDGTTIEKPVKEFSGIADLIQELHHYGQRGPDFSTNEKHYFRYGEMVLEMDPDTFYVRMKGVITSPTDTVEKTSQLNKILQEANTISGDEYYNFKSNTGDTFFDDVSHWIDGEHSQIGIERENIYNAITTVGMFLSESIRCFQNHISNMMSLDLAKNGFLPKEDFFREHPMARGKTWQVKKPSLEGNGKGVKKTGLEMLRDTRARAKKYPFQLQRSQKQFDRILNRISRISKSWLSHVDNTELKGSRHLPPQATEEQYTGQETQGDLLSSVEDIGNIRPHSKQYLRKIELTEQLLSAPIMEPEIRSVDTQLEEFSTTEDISSPVRASIALANDHAYVSDVINKQIQLKEQQTGKLYEVLPESFVTTDNTMKFQVREKANSKSQPEELSVTIDEAKLTSKDFVEDLHSKAKKVSENPPSPENKVSTINRGLAIYGVVQGLSGSIEALENGHTTEGAISLSQSLHGIGELTGFNRAIYRATGKFLGRALRGQVKAIGESVTTVAGEETGSLLKSAGGEVLSTVGEESVFLEDVPIVGTAFGIYNIYEDFQRHSTIGYIDAGLDIAITGLSFLGPEAEPVVLALTIIRMGIDTFYRDIKHELDSLPPNASTLQKVGAVFKGIGKAFEDVADKITGGTFSVFGKSKKLEDQFDKDGVFLDKLYDYQNYFKIVKEEGTGAKDINFAGGSESWNGGDITFILGESGQSKLAIEATDSDGELIFEKHAIDTQGVQDIIMGIGESHSITFKKHEVKMFWAIPTDTAYLISGSVGERKTLHGTYYGNSQDNKFIAVQQLPPQGNSLGYNLKDYSYRLYGEGGDDIFYLGPQHTYVEGNDGSDTYFVNSTSVYTHINNRAFDGKTDFLIFNFNYNRLIPKREGLHLRISTREKTHTLVVENWFHDDTHQHMVFKSRDGVLFKVSATGSGRVEFLPYALSSALSAGSVVLDARKHSLSHVTTLLGTKYDDVMYGNAMDNHISGDKGNDKIFGGEGKDTYSIGLNDGIDTIDNYATDGKVDLLMFAAKADKIIFWSRDSSNDLHITRSGSTGDKITGAVVKNWFLNGNYRHLLLVSEDGVVLNISSTKEQIVKVQPMLVDMSLIPSTKVQPVKTVEKEFTFTFGDKNTLSTVKDRKITETLEKEFTFTFGDKNTLSAVKDGKITDLFSETLDINFGTDESLNRPKENEIDLDFDIDDELDNLDVEMGTVYQRKVDLSNDPLLLKVVTVFGSVDDDLIIGNDRDNYMSSGKGTDSMKGREGKDTYVTKEGDGKTTIRNIAQDKSTDTLLFGARFHDVHLSTTSEDLVLTAHKTVPAKKIQVIVKDWFLGERYQHMLVRSIDGIVFQLPTSKQSLVKAAKVIDISKLKTNSNFNLTETRWTQVERVIGTQANDTVLGNTLSNYLDPQQGRCFLYGNNGSDTYVVGNYGKGNIIYNHAYDNHPDTVLFKVPFFSINAKVRKNKDIQMTSITGRGHVNARLKDYVYDAHTRHLIVLTEDGISFVLPPVTNYKPVPIIINKAKATTGQHIDLLANSTFSEVRTVYGAKRLQNHIIGNQQNNTIVGGNQDDLLLGLDGNDILKGGAGGDTLLGEAGDDTLVGGPGDDWLEGGNGDDIISPGLGSDHVNGGPGTDTVVYGGNVTSLRGIHLDLKHKKCIHTGNTEDKLISVENAYGTEYDDMLQGDDEDNVLVGRGGHDYLVPGSGYDVLNGGNGNDTYNLSAANGTVVLQNYATDRAWDKVIMTYTKMALLGYEKVGNDLVVRVIDTQYPVYYDGTKPTVIFKGWYIDSRLYHHAYVDTADGRIESKFLKRHARKAGRRAATQQ